MPFATSMLNWCASGRQLTGVCCRGRRRFRRRCLRRSSVETFWIGGVDLVGSGFCPCFHLDEKKSSQFALSHILNLWYKLKFLFVCQSLLLLAALSLSVNQYIALSVLPFNRMCKIPRKIDLELQLYPIYYSVLIFYRSRIVYLY